MKSNFNQKKIDRHIDYIDKKIEEYKHALDQQDEAYKQEKLKQKIEYQQRKKRSIKPQKNNLMIAVQSTTHMRFLPWL